MFPAILGKKLNMTQVYTADGQLFPATLIQAGPCWITQIKTKQKDRYSAVQIGFAAKNRLSRPLKKHLEKAGINRSLRYLHEIRIDQQQLETNPHQFKPGTEINIADIFKIGDLITVTGTAKGKGFAGVIKRHGFAGGPRTHGQSDRQRAPGSIGAGTTPGRVHKGKRMAGRSGGHQVTISNLLILSIDSQSHQILVKGAVPGHPQGFLVLKKTGHNNNFPGIVKDQPPKKTPAPSEKPQEKETPEKPQKETKKQSSSQSSKPPSTPLTQTKPQTHAQI